LFKEFEEAGLPGFDSELSLLRRTEEFYRTVAKRRLTEELGGLSTFMLAHFKHRWKVDRDFYAESISKNIEYLHYLVNVCEESFECYLQNLRRGGIAKEILG
jgi:hypothetical protein